MAKALVVYFSRSGTAEQAARVIADDLRADVEALRPVRGYGGGWGFAAALLQGLRNAAPPVHPVRDAAKYELVVLVAPVWAGKLAAPMRSYLKRQGAGLGPYAAVWVSASGGAYPAVGEEIAGLVGRRPEATLPLAERQVIGGAAGVVLAGFVRGLQRTEAAAA